MSNKYLHFSVLMSVYDRESPHYLKLALASIFSQTLLPSEIVLVKDGPINQDLDMVINSFVDQRKIKFLLIQNPHNMGLSYSLQKGLLASNYDVVARMDTDDIAYPSRFERQMEYFISNNVDIVGSYATKISSDGIEKGLLKVPIDNNSIHQLIWTCPFIHPTVMFTSFRHEKSAASMDGANL